MSVAITLGVQAGDSEVDAALEPFYMPLRKLLAQTCIGPYSDAIDEFAIVLRIDGSIWHWGFEGCKDLRLHRKKRYITIDIGVPRSKWENTSPAEVKRYLADCVKDSVALMVRKLASAKVDVKAAELFDCCKRALEQYCAS